MNKSIPELKNSISVDDNYTPDTYNKLLETANKAEESIITRLLSSSSSSESESDIKLKEKSKKKKKKLKKKKKKPKKEEVKNMLKKALEKEEERIKEVDRIMKMDERKRPYNSMYEVAKPTDEEIEAYHMKKRRDDDPMANFI